MTASRGIVCLVVACGLLAIAIAPHHAARADGRVLDGACARADVMAVGRIDQHAQQRTIPSPLLAEAALRVLQARNACLHGRVAVALETYEAALRFLGTDLVGR